VAPTEDVSSFHFYIDVLGSCNLRCPSCPVGNSPSPPKTGLMSPDTLRAVIDKAVHECHVTSVGLFNWTEPLLHPKLAEMIRIVRSRDIPCHLSSNLNVLPNIDDVIHANPTSLRISLSGFEQDTYGVTHRAGNIEIVKTNMRLLAEARERAGSGLDVHVLFHRYLCNHGDEAKMRAFSDSLGFGFQPVWAFLMPLEKNLAFLGDETVEARITRDDEKLIDRLALRPDEASDAVQKHKHLPCNLLEEQITLNSRAEVQLCCTTFDQSKYGIAPYLTTPLAEIQTIRRSHSMCTRCVDKGMHIVSVYGGPELEQLAMSRVEARYPDANLGPTVTATPAPAKKAGRARQIKRRLKRWLRRASDHPVLPPGETG